MNTTTITLMIALVAFVLTAQTAYGVGVDVLKNGTLVANNNPPGPPINGTTGMPGNLTDPNAETNEHDYKRGLDSGFSNYWCAAHTEQPSDEDCFDVVRSNDNVDVCSGIALAHGCVSNSTACYDGYKNGWLHWCFSDTKTCALYISKSVFPGTQKDNSTYVQGNYTQIKRWDKMGFKWW